ncbi:MAG: DUF2207 domain-containing protein [Clostridia bacterium]|nr:DUF2207 domain-containing protein [Clostridia bacterium]
MTKAFTADKRSKSRLAACFVFILLLLALLAVTLSGCMLLRSEIVLKSLDITVDVGADGRTTFTETMEADFSHQDTDWWNFYRIIDDETLIARVREDKTAFTINGDSFRVNGKAVEFVGALDLDADDAKYTYTRMYSDAPVGYFYARSGGIEIGVILPRFESGARTISYSYSVKGIVTGIADASVFYYKYLSEINSMDVEKMSVKVNLPKAEPELRGWLHNSGSAIGVWKQTEDKKGVEITVEDVSAGEYIETRLLLSKGGYSASKVDTSVTTVDVANEEQRWYDDYQRKQRLLLAVTILDYVLGVLALAFGVVTFFVAKRKNRPLDLDGKPIYYREIPEGYTGGEVSPLYFYYSSEKYVDESIAATMLELVRLGYITIMPDEKKKGAVITVLKKDEEDELRTHQKYVVEMLSLVKPMGSSFTMKEFEQYGKNHPGKMIQMVRKYEEAIKNKSERDGAYQKGNKAQAKAQRFATSMVGVGVAVVVLSGFANFFLGRGMFFFGAGVILGGLIHILLSKRLKSPLTVAGQTEYDKLHALARFMQEFSSMDEHEIPELALWEDYMVFATAMGIADKVSEQLEIAYPEFKTMSASNFDASTFMILWFFSPSFRLMTGLNFVGNISNVIRSVHVADRAIRAANLAKKVGGNFRGGGGFGGGSSFHGGGGGFSGGGFGGRR